jgi:hypothetical protein
MSNIDQNSDMIIEATFRIRGATAKESDSTLDGPARVTAALLRELRKAAAIS